MIISETVARLFEEFNRKNIPYCVLRNYENLPENIGHDLDIFILEEDIFKINEIISHIKEKMGWQYLFSSNIYISIFSYIFFDNKRARNTSSILHIDFFTRIVWHRINLLDIDMIIKNRIKYKNYYIIHPAMGAIQRLLQPLLNEDKIREKYKEFISENSTHYKEIFVCNLSYKLGNNLTNFVMNKIEEREFSNIEKNLFKIKNVLLFNEIKKNPIYFFTVFKLIVSKIKYILNPCGIFAIILGPDGSGKGAIINGLRHPFKKIFIDVQNLHWRPGIFPRLNLLLGQKNVENLVSNPHVGKHKKRNFTISFMRWLYYTLDFIVGYYLKVLPLKIKDSAVVFDRYYYDYFIDPIRYGFNLPPWIFKVALPFVPKPDLTIYLDNTPQNLYARKQELPINELERQVNEFRKLIPELPNPHIVTTDKPLEEVVNEVTKIILEKRAEMTGRMLKIDPPASMYLWNKEQTCIALPSKKNCRWIMPTSKKAFKRSWDLYQPYSLRGKLYKGFMRSTSSLSPFRPGRTIKADSWNAEISENLRDILERILDRKDIIMAISTGTPGPYRKITGLVMSDEGESLAYVKIGETGLAIERIKHEASVLKELGIIGQKAEGRRQNLEITVRMPEYLYDGKIGNAHVLIQSSAPFEGKSGKSDFNEDYAEVLNALIKDTMVKKKYIESEFYKKLRSDIENYPLSFRELLRSALNYLEKNIGGKESIFALSHGDFAPWNMAWKGNEVFLYDWESACFEAPVGIDLVHFLFQTKFLLRKLRCDKLLAYLLTSEPYWYLNEKSNNGMLETKLLVLCYLLHIAVWEDIADQLSPAAVERRNLIKLLLKDGK